MEKYEKRCLKICSLSCEQLKNLVCVCVFFYQPSEFRFSGCVAAVCAKHYQSGSESRAAGHLRHKHKHHFKSPELCFENHVAVLHVRANRKFNLLSLQKPNQKF